MFLGSFLPTRFGEDPQFLRMIRPGVTLFAKVYSSTKSLAGASYNNYPHLIVPIRLIESIDHFIQHLMRNRI